MDGYGKEEYQVANLKKLDGIFQHLVEKTVKVLIEASHFKDYFKKLDEANNNNNNKNKTKLKKDIKTILNHLDKNIVGFYHSFILCDKYLPELIKLQHHIESFNNHLISKETSKEVKKEDYLRYTMKIKKLLSNNKEMAKILHTLIDEIYYPKFLQNKHNKDQEIQQYTEKSFTAIK